MLRDLKMFAGQEFGAQNKLLSSFVGIPRKSHWKEKLWAGKVLLLFRCLLKGEREGEELALCVI